MVLLRGGQARRCAEVLSTAAEAEDTTEKATVTPWAARSRTRTLWRDVARAGLAPEALAAFEATLAKEPNRLRGLAGAAKAAEQSGDKAKAKGYYEKILAMVGDADSTRPEIADARAFLKKL